MFKEIKQGVLFTLVTMVLLGGVYHVVLGGSGARCLPVRPKAA
jgi:hypothetical protein